MTVHAMRRPLMTFDPQEPEHFLSVDETRQLSLAVSEAMPTLPTQRIVLEAAVGRVLADPISNHEPLPRYDGATMDGFAIRRGDLVGPGPWKLHIDGKLAAGTKKSERPVCTPGGALEVATGAQVFGSLDAVIPHEQVERDGDIVTVFQCPARNTNIHARGQDAKVGTDLLPAGRVLSTRDIALLAGLGRAEVNVRQRLRVACLSVGSELIEVGTKLAREEMHDCNRPMLKAALNHEWITYLDLGLIADNPRVFKDALPLAAGAADVVIVAGGTSGGVQSTLSEAVTELGGEIAVHNVAMKPGKPLMVASLNGSLCICMPGNPVSVTILLEVLGWDLLRSRSGITDAIPGPKTAIAGFSMLGRPGRAEYPLVRVERLSDQGIPVLGLSLGANSANLRRLAESDGFLHIAPDNADIKKGDPLIWSPF